MLVPQSMFPKGQGRIVQKKPCLKEASFENFWFFTINKTKYKILRKPQQLQDSDKYLEQNKPNVQHVVSNVELCSFLRLFVPLTTALEL